MAAPVPGLAFRHSRLAVVLVSISWRAEENIQKAAAFRALRGGIGSFLRVQGGGGLRELLGGSAAKCKHLQAKCHHGHLSGEEKYQHEHF